MDAYFVEMLGRLKLTKKQKADAKAKYNRVSKTLHKAFYDTEYDGSTKLLIGSYGKRTNIRPPSDIDLLFKIPADVFEHYAIDYKGNGASALLQKIRAILNDEYTTSETPKAWGKVVLVNTGEGSHNIELLPAFEIGGGVYKIPNTAGDGGFEDFDVGADLAVVSKSNTATGGVTRKLIKIVKRWKSLHESLHIKSFEIEAYVANYLATNPYENVSWSKIVSGFFEWLQLQSVHPDDVSLIETASNRMSKAIAYEHEDNIKDATLEWRKVFTTAFPAYDKNKATVHALSKSWPATTEEFIEDMYPVRIANEHNLRINAEVEIDKFRRHGLSQFLEKFGDVPKHAKMHFTVHSDIPEPVEYHWKVRNFGIQAAQAEKGFRGQINGQRGKSIIEPTLYKGKHYVEVYAIKDEKCVARTMRFVPIGDEA